MGDDTVWGAKTQVGRSQTPDLQAAPNKRTPQAGIALTVALLFTTGALSAPPSGRTILVKDKCDPATFPVPCVGDGDVTFGDFVNQLTASQQAGGWRFAPAQATIEAGTPLTVTNTGGEEHVHDGRR